MLVGALALGSGACSSDDPAESSGRGQEASDASPALEPARLQGPVTAGTISSPADPNAIDLGAAGYVEEEFFAAGRATAYEADGGLGTDGVWNVKPRGNADYQTRLVVRRPADEDDFNGIVIVEWFNETGGTDAAPDWSYYGTELVRDGAAWVGVSAQALGINGGHGLLSGGGAPSGGLKATKPERYGSLVHPGDQFSYDIFSQVGAALRSPGDTPVLGDLEAEHLIASGESQSAFFLTTYVNAFQPRAEAYDGFFIHSRGGPAAPLDGSGITGSSTIAAAEIRPDLEAPVLIFQTETDVGPLLGYASARQDDSEHIRTWEVAGTAHADAHLAGSLASSLGCPGRINEGPQHYVANAALAALVDWVADGTEPPNGAPLETTADAPARLRRDARGIALGGIRTPPVDVPVTILSGDPAPGASTLCSLFGTTTPIDPATLQSLYPTRGEYLDAFDEALDQAISAGFVLEADRAAFAAEARAAPI